ncbi:hypothetical protein GCM10017786_19600 [Amycolatopsis deserti]|uniref:Uncharacterized protein n=1 Tax=Amycolatopsis deserti TaxID=185696 RepID=A0ABQ3INF9_9PSEU|nr:hypothetical protein [Amycolatopsis deserti]GHE87845.1 hypothetical protein GCM10017786_19600 [Amycolatopsis deserti]
MAAPFDGHAVVRGFEIIGVESDLMNVHSWLCHGYEADAGVHLNQWGLIGSHAQVSSVLAWMLELPAEEAPEPVYWTVAAIAEVGHALS